MLYTTRGNLIRQIPNRRSWKFVGSVIIQNEPYAFFLREGTGEASKILAIYFPSDNSDVSIYWHNIYVTGESDSYSSVTFSCITSSNVYFYSNFHIFSLAIQNVPTEQDICNVIGYVGSGNRAITGVFYDESSPTELCVAMTSNSGFYSTPIIGKLRSFRVGYVVESYLTIICSGDTYGGDDIFQEVFLGSISLLVRTICPSQRDSLSHKNDIFAVRITTSAGYTAVSNPGESNCFVPFVFKSDYLPYIYGLMINATEKSSVAVQTDSGKKNVLKWSNTLFCTSRDIVVVDKNGDQCVLFSPYNKIGQSQCLKIRTQDGYNYLYTK